MFSQYGDYDANPFGRPMYSRGTFSETYRCYSVAMMPGKEREEINFGGKIIMPPSALQKLASLHIEYPMLFHIENNNDKTKSTHAGVLEFIAQEGRCHFPRWMMKTLGVEEGSLVTIKSTSLPLGKFVKIQPQSVDFLDVSDPKAVLERAFRSFSTLTQGDIISISYNDKLYDILVMEAKPGGKGISIIETDLEVDFAPPVGYVEPERQSTMGRAGSVHKQGSSIEAHTVKEKPSFMAFGGSGQRLSGKENVSQSYGAESTTQKPQASEDGVPAALVLPPGKLYFGYPVKPLKKEGVESASNGPKFEGAGQSLRESRKKGKGNP